MAFDSETFNKPEVTARDRLVMLRDFLATLPDEKFDMGDCGSELWTHPDCGSPACIGGWARILYLPRHERYLDLREVGDRYLDLDAIKATDLFFPNGDNWLDGAVNATAVQAARVLDHLLNTGNVDWAVAFQNPAEPGGSALERAVTLARADS